MPRSALPERERAICQRLQIWREQRGIKRKDFAAALGLRADSYSGYEYARAPVHYKIACQIVEQFAINAWWLATGDGPNGVRIPLPTAESLGVSPRSLFSEVYDTYLAQSITRQTEAVVSQFNMEFPLDASMKFSPVNVDREKLSSLFSVVVNEWLMRLPDAAVAEFANGLFKAGEDLFKQYPVESEDVVEMRRTVAAVQFHLRNEARKQLGIPAIS